MPGSTWSVDAVGASSLLVSVDRDAQEFCGDAALVGRAQGEVTAGLTGSRDVSRAFSGFVESHESVAGRVAGRLQRSASAAIACVDAVVFADQQMAGDADRLAVAAELWGGAELFSSRRFGAGPR